jgi:phosphoribosylanthranilate isomerase
MIQPCKICGISDSKTLEFLTSHPTPPKMIGFICNWPKSKRFVEYDKLKELLKVDKKKSEYVAVLVKPKNILEKIKDLPFDYYQIYDSGSEEIKSIKEKYNKKIITAITVKDKEDVKKYKEFESISDIILFDSMGYERSLNFNHQLLNDVPNTFTKMIAGNIQIDMNFKKLLEKAEIIDISGALESEIGIKDLKKIDIFLKNIKKYNEK